MNYPTNLNDAVAQTEEYERRMNRQQVKVLRGVKLLLSQIENGGRIDELRTIHNEIGNRIDSLHEALVERDQTVAWRDHIDRKETEADRS